MRKGQVTLFIILGIVLVAAFAFITLLINMSTEKNIEQKRSDVIDELTGKRATEGFISTCTGDALKTGLILLGEQGGVIYNDQLGGTIPRDGIPTTEYNGIHIAEGLGPSKETFQQPPQYPCSSGTSPSYCRYEIGSQDQKNADFGRNNFAESRGLNSLTRQLESYIEEYMQLCVNLESVAQELGFNIQDVNAGEVKADIQFGTSTVAVTIAYPLEITSNGRYITTEFSRFDAQLPVRIRTIHTLIKNILKKEEKDINYILKEDIFNDPDYTFLSEQIQFTAVEDTGIDDIFIFNDTLSVIENQTYVFYVTRKNRPPVLSYINKNPSLPQDDVYDYLLINGEDPTPTGTLIDLQNVITKDPDEDEPLETTTSPIESVDGAGFTGSGHYTQTITVSDGEKEDWQVVRILVEPLLQPSFIVDNGFNDIDNGYISREDPAFFDASQTNQTLDPYANYTFIWGMQPSAITDHACSIFPFYTRCDAGEYTINFGINDVFEELINIPTNTVSRISLDVNLEYNKRKQTTIPTTQPNAVIVQNAQQELQVANCLPHRNPTDPPYPYNTGDPFQANHACCLGNPSQPETWQVAGPQTECYRNEQLLTEQGRFIYSQKVERDYCLSNRGNICGNGDAIPEITTITETTLCSTNAASECTGNTAYNNQDGGWCYGTDGCQLFCTTHTVDQNDNLNTDQADTCGCTDDDMRNSKKCDKNFDGHFQGICKSRIFGLGNYCDE
jgi:hypothetical protein